jgi:hypothetical protein
MQSFSSHQKRGCMADDRMTVPFSRNGGTHANGKAHPNGPAVPSEEDQNELALLDALLQDNSWIAKASVAETDFRTLANQLIYGAIRHLCGNGQPATLASVAIYLHQHGKGAEVRPQYLAGLLHATFAPELAPYFAGLVREQGCRRSLALAASEIRRAAQEGKPLLDLAQDLQEQALALETLARGVWPSTQGNGLDEIDALNLQEEEIMPLDYLPLLSQDGYLVHGWSHLLAGYPRSGKTELLSACCRDWLAMGERVLYFTEEPRSIWQQRLSRTGSSWSGMKIVFALGAKPADLLSRAERGEEGLVVVDSIRNLGLLGQDENDNAALARAVSPWIQAMRGRKTLVLTHHSRKGNGEHGEGIAGGHALLGLVDIALELRYDPAASRRLVRAYARLIQPAELMYERRQDGSMHALGSPQNVTLAEVRKRVREAVDADWLSTADVRERLGDPKPHVNQVRNALQDEAEAGTIERDPPLSESVERKKLRWRARGGGENLHCTP